MSGPGARGQCGPSDPTEGHERYPADPYNLLTTKVCVYTRWYPDGCDYPADTYNPHDAYMVFTVEPSDPFRPYPLLHVNAIRAGGGGDDEYFYAKMGTWGKQVTYFDPDVPDMDVMTGAIYLPEDSDFGAEKYVNVEESDIPGKYCNTASA